MPSISRLTIAVQAFAVCLSSVLAASVSQEYDYVIVGGGLTGLVVANRLSEDKTSTRRGNRAWRAIVNSQSRVNPCG